MDVIIYSASASSWAFIFLDSCLLLSLLSLQLLYIQHLKLSWLPLLTLRAVLETVDRAGFSPCLSTVPSAIAPRINDAPVIPSAQFFVHLCASHINQTSLSVSWAHICRPAQMYHFIVRLRGSEWRMHWHQLFKKTLYSSTLNVLSCPNLPLTHSKPYAQIYTAVWAKLDELCWAVTEREI